MAAGKTRYFLDTTVHLERHAGDADRRKAINDRLGTDEHSTSTHVQREWRHIVDGGAVAVLNAIDSGATDLPDIFARLAQGYGRSPGQRLRLLAMLAGQQMDATTLRVRARTFLRSSSDALFRHRMTVRDGSRCGLARETPVRNEKGDLELRQKCRKAECECAQPDFFASYEAEVVEIGSALKATNYAAMGRKAIQAVKSSNPLDSKGQNCWGGSGIGGDISIALESGADEVLLTTDRSFDLICPAIGRAHERLAPTPPP